MYISVRLWPSRRGYTGSRESVTIWSKGEAMLLAPHFFPDNVLTTSVPVDKSMLLRRRLSSWFRIHGTALNWFRSYLSSRCFRVKCNNDFSSTYLPLSFTFILYTFILSADRCNFLCCCAHACIYTPASVSTS